MTTSLHGAATDASLVPASATVRPGDTIMAGIRLRMQPTWHTYWRNPGASGLATSVTWELPPGVTAGDIQWPVPEKLLVEGLTTYIYENEVVLLVPLKIAANVPAGNLELKAKVSWLECATMCVPGNQNVAAKLAVGGETSPGPDAFLIANWQQKLPLVKPDLAARAWWEKPATGDTRPIIFEWPATAAKEADFYPYASDKIDVKSATESTPAIEGKVRLPKLVQKFEGDWPDKIQGLLVQKSDTGTVAYEVNLPITSGEITSGTAPVATPSPANPPTNSKSLVLMLLYAFLGGLALNVMPCVLPVIALKILGFVNQGREHPAQVRKLGLIYALGVLVSFLGLAAVVIAVKQAGHLAGWGLQFGNPEFIVVMTVLVTLVALNLFGLFEINLSGKVMGAAGNLGAREGSAGAFFNGVLATVLATPCTAPFLGVALGFAFAQSYGVIILFFLTVGVGLAAPYVVLSWNPALLKLLPRPGAWMEKFKIAMGFPMLATAIWLLNLTVAHYGKRVLWLGFFLVLVGLAAWIYGEFVQRGRNRKGLAAAFVLAILIGGYFFTVEDNLRWRSPITETAGAASHKDNPDGIEWQPWSPKALADARSAGHPVLVDFTADWCQVCQVNRKTSIEVKRVQQKLKELNAVALEGDYTKLPDSITTELAHFGRAGVPLVLVYPADASAPPEVLPDGYLTPGIVISALEKAQTPARTTASNR